MCRILWMTYLDISVQIQCGPAKKCIIYATSLKKKKEKKNVITSNNY